eukprot:g7788.t1
MVKCLRCAGERRDCSGTSPGVCTKCSEGQFKDNGLTVAGGKAWFRLYSLTYCPAGSEMIQQVALGNWINKSSNGQWVMAPCAAGYFCPNDTAYGCPAGHYCPVAATAPIVCGGPRFYCPPKAGAKVSVGKGNYSMGGSSEATHTAQAMCGDPAHFCVAGVRRNVSAGFYSTPLLKSATTRDGESMCEEGFFCKNGVRVRCGPGARCSAGSDSEARCGGVNKFCLNGTEIYVQPGYYSVDANETDAMATRDRRTGERMCPDGWFCRQGVKRPCGEVGVYCPKGSSEPVRALEGYFTGPLASNATHRYMVTPCGCNERLDGSAPLECGSFQYYCSGGLRFEVPPRFYALRDKSDNVSAADSVSAAEQSARLVDKQACNMRDIC